MAERLPNFERPPVVETVLGVQFKPLPQFRNAHLGAFWKRLGASAPGLLGSDWPNLTDATTLEPTAERFGEAESWAPLLSRFRLTNDPAARIQIRNAAGDAMIQLQNGRLHYNWLRQQDGEYPRYEGVRPRFDELLQRFEQFLRDERLGELAADQWEITYVNHVPRETVWSCPDDWPSLLVGLPGVWSTPSTVRLESFGGAWHFEIEPQRGRLHVEVRHARTSSNKGSEVLRLTLTARGPVSDDPSRGLTLDEGLELGRKSIVMTFKEITSPKAHSYWGLRNEHA